MRSKQFMAVLLTGLAVALNACGAASEPAPAETAEVVSEEVAEVVSEETAEVVSEEASPEAGQEETRELTRADKLLAEAEAGNGRSYTDLGKLYEQGTGVDRDYAKALEYYLLSAEAEEPDFKGMRLAGLLYLNGTGVRQDDARAAECFQKAAEAGDVSACWYLGQLYEEGRGVPEDAARAKEWYEAGLADLDRFTGGSNKGPDELKQILCRLAEMALEEGDIETGAGYYQTAADLGWEPAIQALEELGMNEEED